MYLWPCGCGVINEFIALLCVPVLDEHQVDHESAVKEDHGGDGQLLCCTTKKARCDIRSTEYICLRFDDPESVCCYT